MNFDPLILGATLFALIVGVALHEFAHALAGHYLGDTTAKDQGRLTLNPLAHIDPFATVLLPLLLLLAGLPVFAAAKPVPFNPWALRGGKWGVALVALAGPMTNLFIAVAVGLWMHLLPPESAVSFVVLGTMVGVNVGLFVFNLIPIPPLDGSRVLYAASPARVREVMDNLERAGLVVIFGVVLLLSYTPLGMVLSKTISGLVSLLIPSGLLP